MATLKLNMDRITYKILLLPFPLVRTDFQNSLDLGLDISCTKMRMAIMFTTVALIQNYLHL